MSSVAKPQDLPPPGGFSKIHYDKVPHKTIFNGTRIALFTVISYGIGLWGYSRACKRMSKTRLERTSAQNAIQPFLLAERDRQVLRQMRKNRDVEAELMKDVEGWEVGTLYGTPVYNTVGDNEWIGYDTASYYAHTDPDKRSEMEHFTFWV